MGGTKTIQTADINPVNNVDHEERGGEVLDERGEEEDDKEEEAEEEEEVEEEEEAEEEEREEVPPPAVQSRPPSTNTTQRQHANTKYHTHPTRIGGLGIVTKQGPATSTGTTRNPYLAIKKQYRLQPRTDDIEPLSEATAQEEIEVQTTSVSDGERKGMLLHLTIQHC